VICGKNNTGKTYTTYALFGFLESKSELLEIEVKNQYIDSLLNDGNITIDLQVYIDNVDNILNKACTKYSKNLSDIFASNKESFKNTVFNIELFKNPEISNKVFEHKIGSGENTLFSLTKEKNSHNLSVSLLSKETIKKVGIPHKLIKDIVSDSIVEIIFSDLLPNVFIASAERTGAAIFKDELDFARSRLLKEIHKSKEVNGVEILLNSKQNYGYALPVEKNVEFIRNLKNISKKDSFIKKDHPEILNKFNQILGGKYKLDKNDNLNFKPNKCKTTLEIGESSSAVRSLLDLGFYINHIAKTNDLLIIDEPELNLHPENQRLIAQVLANLVNLGIKIFITTHSDYIIKEFSTLVMLNKQDDYLKMISKDAGYVDDDYLKAEQLKMYIAKEDFVKLDGNTRKTKNNTLTKVAVDDENGIEDIGFDDTINKMNEIQQSIIWR
jgi:predicted ATPase